MSAPVHYKPNGYPPAQIDWVRLVPLIDEASAAIAGYGALLKAIPNPGVLLSPLSTNEAVLSSRIEGIQVSLAEVLEIEAGGGEDLPKPKLDDAEEIRNYRNALLYASGSLGGRRFSLFGLRESHRLLMQGVRGQNKAPGSFRQRQNWIGFPGCLMDQAKYVPAQMEFLHSALENWERYYLSDEEPSPLVQLALIHAEFEAIHPFLDGNGRVGRMLIPLFLFEQDKLPGPYFYMSGYLERHREVYYEKLLAISRDDAWTEWCEFFLNGVIGQATEDQKKVEEIIRLYKKLLVDVTEMTKSKLGAQAVEFLFCRPVFASKDFLSDLNVPRPTSLRLLGVFRKNDIVVNLREKSGRKHAIYVFPQLMDIIN